MCLEASFTGASCGATVRAAIPFRWTMSTFDCLIVWFIHISPIDAFFALQEVLSCSEACCLIKSNTSIWNCFNALITTWNHIGACFTSLCCHEVSLFTYTSTSDFISILIFTAWFTGAHPILNSQWVTRTLCALVKRSTFNATRDCRRARSAITLL